MDHPVDLALQAQLPPSALTGVEQEDYLDRLEELQLLPSQAENEFFASRQLRGVGVGLDDAGNLVYQQRCGGTVPTANSER